MNVAPTGGNAAIGRNRVLQASFKTFLRVKAGTHRAAVGKGGEFAIVDVYVSGQKHVIGCDGAEDDRNCVSPGIDSAIGRSDKLEGRRLSVSDRNEVGQ